MQKCTDCQKEYDITDFYLNYGKRRPTCKYCCKVAKQKWSATSQGRNKIRSYGRTATAKANYKRFYQTEKGIASRRRGKLAEKLSLKSRARDAVKRALACGKLFRTNLCVSCFDIGKTNFHHYIGYEPHNRLNVMELCTKCHGEEHRRYQDL